MNAGDSRAVTNYISPQAIAIVLGAIFDKGFTRQIQEVLGWDIGEKSIHQRVLPINVHNWHWIGGDADGREKKEPHFED